MNKINYEMNSLSASMEVMEEEGGYMVSLDVKSSKSGAKSSLVLDGIEEVEAISTIINDIQEYIYGNK